MISVAILAGDGPDDPERARVAVARSLGWLVSAVVAGVVGDVVIAATPQLELVDIADQVGCELVQAMSEQDRIRGAVARMRRPFVLVMRAGYAPRGPLVEEIDARLREGPPDAGSYPPAALLLAPSTLVQRLRPSRAPIVGVLASREAWSRAASFADLARACKGRDRFANDAVG